MCTVHCMHIHMCMCYTCAALALHEAEHILTKSAGAAHLVGLWFMLQGEWWVHAL